MTIGNELREALHLSVISKHIAGRSRTLCIAFGIFLQLFMGVFNVLSADISVPSNIKLNEAASCAVTGSDLSKVSISLDSTSPSGCATISTSGNSFNITFTKGGTASVTASGCEGSSKFSKTVSISCNGDCDDISSVDIGSFSISINPKITGTYDSSTSKCTYTTSNATISGSISDVYSASISLPNTTVTVVKKAETIESVSASWSSTAGADYNFGPFKAKIKSLSLSKASGGLSGSINFDVNVVDDASLTNQFYATKLKKGAAGTFSYVFTNGAGKWQFNISNLNVGLYVGEKEVGNATVGSINEEAKCTNVSLTATPTPVTINGYTLTLNTLNATFDADLKNSVFTLKTGSGQMTVKQPKGMGKDILLDFDLTPNGMTANVNSKKVVAFGAEIAGDFTIVINNSFMNVSLIEGEGLTFKHKDICGKDGSAELKNISFKIENGELKTLSIPKCDFKYLSFHFAMTNTDYDVNVGLVINATCNLTDAYKMLVSNYKIDQSGGITFQKIAVDINKNPLYIHGDAGLQSTEIKGNLDAALAGAGIQAAFTLGSEAQYNYAFVLLSVDAGNAGIPLGSSGFKLKGATGMGGYNCEIVRSGSSFTMGSKGEGLFAAGLGITISDAGNIVSLGGTGVINLGGADPTLLINGAVTIPASSPYYFNGQMQVDYHFGASYVKAGVQGTLNIPRGTGTILKISNATMTTKVYGATGNWDVSGKANGKILQTVDMVVSQFMYSKLSDGISGQSNGTISFAQDGTYAYPSNFSPTNTDNTNWAGFGIYWTYELAVAGTYAINLSESAYTGTIGGSVNVNSSATCKWPGIPWITSGGVNTYNINASGNLSLSNQSGSTVASGDLTFTYNNESTTKTETAAFSCAIDGEA